MSIAVALRKNRQLALGTDSQTSFGSSRVPSDNLKTTKIHQVGPTYLATTGWGLYENILDDYLARAPEGPRLETKGAIFAFFMAFWKELHESYSFVKDQSDKDDESPFGSLDASFLVISREGVFHVGADMSVTAFEKYYAIGSGADYALGAISAIYHDAPDAVTTCRKAIEAAIDFDVHCGGEIDIRVIDLD